MRLFFGALLLTAGSQLPAQMASRSSLPAGSAPSVEKLTYDIEWRLIHAGTAVFETQKGNVRLKLDSAGLVSTLFKVNDTYTVNYDEPFCAVNSWLDSQEGKRHHDTRVTYDRSRNRAEFIERDVIKNSVLHSGGVAIPNCVHDVMGALLSLRGLSLNPGQSAQMPVSDGRRTASVRIEAQEREEIKTPTGAHKAIRCEALLMNGIVYTRRGRVFIWVTDDARRMPVQIQLRIAFPVGTVTLHLQKEEHF